MAGKTIQGEILLRAEFSHRRCGVMDIYVFKNLDLHVQEGERVYFEVAGGRFWSGGQEPRGYQHREIEPYNRMRPFTYIPHGYDVLDILPTFHGGRFLSLKKSWPTCTTFASTDQYPKREKAVILRDRRELKIYLNVILLKMGVPLWNLQKIKKDIVAKLYPPF